MLSELEDFIILYCFMISAFCIFTVEFDFDSRCFLKIWKRQKSFSLVIIGKCIFTDTAKAEGSVGHFADDSSVMPSMTDVCVDVALGLI